MFSTIPAVIDGLVALCRASDALQGVQVVDGQFTTDEELTYLAIGYSDDDIPAITGDQQTAEMGNRRRTENYTISCVASVASGDTEAKPVRDATFALIEAVGQVLHDNPDVGVTGVSLFADLSGGIEVVQEQGADGFVCSVLFHVTVHYSRI